MHNFNRALLFLLVLLLINPTNMVMGEDSDNSISELESELNGQRADYEKILKNLKAEEFLNDPSISKLIKSGELDFDKIEATVRGLQKQEADKIYGQFNSPKLTSLLSGGAHEQINRLLIPIQQIPEDKLKANLTHNLKEGMIKRFIDGSDGLQNFIVKLLKSDRALPQAALILDNKNRLYIFVLINITIFVLLKLRKMIINRRNSKNKFYNKSFFDGLVGWIIKTIGMLGFRIALFVYFFHKEMGPTWEIFEDTML